MDSQRKADSYDQGTQCENIEEQMRLLEEESKSDQMHPSKWAKLLRARRRRDEYLSKALVKKVSKPCATCGVAIEKNEGWVKIVEFLRAQVARR